MALHGMEREPHIVIVSLCSFHSIYSDSPSIFPLVIFEIVHPFGSSVVMYPSLISLRVGFPFPERGWMRMRK